MPWPEVLRVCHQSWSFLEPKQYHGLVSDVSVKSRPFELAFAGGSTAVFVSPLEVLKTRLQTQVKGQGTKYLGGIHIYGTARTASALVCIPHDAA